MDKLLNQTAVANILGVTAESLRLWRLKGSGPEYTDTDTGVKYAKTAVKSFIEERYEASLLIKTKALKTLEVMTEG